MIERELTVEDYLGMLRRRWPLILILAILGAPLAYGVSRYLPNRYKSQTLVMVEQPTVSTEYVRPVTNSFTSEQLLAMKQEILSRAGLEPIMRRFNLFPGQIDRVPIEKLVNQLRTTIEVSPLRDDADSRSVSGFFVNVTMENPRTAQDVCAAVTSMFISENARRRQEQSQDTTQFLGQQLADAKAKLDEQDAKLAEFKARHMGSLPDDAQTSFGVLSGLTSQLDATTQALTRAQQDKSLAETMLTREIAARRASQTGQNPETFEEQLAALQTKLASLQARYTDDYPDVIKTKTEIEALKKKIAESEGQNKSSDPSRSEKTPLEPLQFAQMRAQIRTDEQAIAEKTKQQERIQEQIRAYEARLQSSPAVEQEFKELSRDHETALAFYNQLLMKRSQSVMSTDLERRQEGEQFRVTDPATLPDTPSFPNRPLFALGGFGGGLALGVGLALLLEMRDTSLRTERDVEVSLRLPVLAMIPSIDEFLSGPGPSQLVEQTTNHSGVGAGATTRG
jgi:polysaccharide chain length determinant protein (PEP-CTERM system associated)